MSLDVFRIVKVVISAYSASKTFGNNDRFNAGDEIPGFVILFHEIELLAILSDDRQWFHFAVGCIHDSHDQKDDPGNIKD